MNSRRFNGAAHSRARKCAEGSPSQSKHSASMGPRTLVRGNSRTGSRRTRPSWLQWGRALSCAEITKAAAHYAAHSVELQWGRALSCAEMDGARKFQRFGSRFNGAAHSRARKFLKRRHVVRVALASMGPRTLVRGNAASYVSL